MNIIIGIVAVIALIIAWTAFNRSGEDVLPTVADEAGEAINEVEQAAENTGDAIAGAAAQAEAEVAQAAARVEARTELLALQAELEAEETVADAEAQVQEIENNLEAAYANASAEVRAEYADIQAGLQNLEDGLRDGTGDVLQTIGGLVLLLEDDVRTDDDGDETVN